MSFRPLAIIGAGALGRISLDIARAANIEVAGFIDDTKPEGSAVDGAAVLGGLKFLENSDLSSWSFAIAIAEHHELRKKIVAQVFENNGSFQSVIHPNADISPHAKLGTGVSIANFVKVHSGAHIEDFCFIEDQSSIGIDAHLGEHSMITTGVKINGRSSCGPRSYFGSGSVLGPKITVGSDVFIGTGAVVLKPLDNKSKVMGPIARALF